jgi:ribosomal protein S12 methylthiotransferase
MRNEKAIKTYYLSTLGCAKNEIDSEAIETDLIAAGLRCADNPKLADLLIVNSCGFINDAKIETINTVLNLHQERKKDSILVLCGCLPARYNLNRSLGEVDLFLPWSRHGELIFKLRAIGWEISTTAAEQKRMPPVLPYAYLRISEGCDNRCAYCAIPDIKGPYTSRPISEILDEAHFLCKNGAKELVLIGQDTTLYGKNEPESTSLVTLLDSLSAQNDFHWIRLMYAHPAHLSDETIDAMAANDKIVKYIDLPLQHINNRILSKMNRKVNRLQIETLLEKLRNKIPGIALRTTFIVGFPGETDNDFRDLLDFCEAARFDSIGIFKYSPEEGTPAYEMAGRLKDGIVEERYLTLLDIQNMISAEKLADNIDRRLNVLVDCVGPDNTVQARAFFQGPEVDGHVMIDSCRAKPGDFLDVIVEKADAYDLFARPLEGR